MADFPIDTIVNSLGILVNSGLAVYIVKSIQKSQDNERSIKDHFMGEVKALREEYKHFLNQVYAGKLYNTEIIPRLKLLGIKSSDLMVPLHFGAGIDRNFFFSYHLDINKIVTDDPNFISSQGQARQVIQFHPDTLDKIIRFQQRYQNTFNTLISKINDSQFKKLP